MNFQEIDQNYGFSQKYKGVVAQQNGNWGAQIYANNRRIWLGTFKSEIEAAMAYDRASMKVRTPDAPRNFPWTKIPLEESNFQSQYPMETILSMIKDGSYQTKFDNFQKERVKETDEKLKENEKRSGFSCRVVFEKELTPSDVGKLNRLVIPKKYAVTYFPNVPEDLEDEVNLSFYDVEKRLWKFRYCYWKSSQSFVFTRGWNQFVKEKKLMAKDKIVFYYHENLEVGGNMGFWVIDTCWSKGNIGVGLKLGVETQESIEDQKMGDGIIERNSVKSKGLKLFGVHIN